MSLSSVNWIAVLNVLAWVLGKLKDTDKDGIPDLFDKDKNEKIPKKDELQKE